jgi:putative acetyltransferase
MRPAADVEIVEVDASSDGGGLGTAAGLFEALRSTLLAAGVPIDAFQGFAAEITAVRVDGGKYNAAKGGALLLAVPAAGIPTEDGGRRRAVGCVALRPLPELDTPDGRTAEIKRLFVAPAARGQGLGRRLSCAIIALARRRGYAQLVLDTLHRLPAALALYEALGFQRTDAYCHNPMPDVVYLRLALRPEGVGTAARVVQQTVVAAVSGSPGPPDRSEVKDTSRK